ncbi:hypothetical protein niasHT_024329 [Heterodera trifolii]|uniref:AAA+ ATPase domain-containing protein n=1 Tax=Heterodera trifolii TaxID=157864 RepID=A0ABD2JMG4_9BILA
MQNAITAEALSSLASPVHCFSTPMALAFIEHLRNEKQQNIVFVDAFTWLRWHFQCDRPYELSFTSSINSSDGIIDHFSRICFVRPFPFALLNFHFAILSPFTAFNLFGISTIGNELTNVFLVNAICVESSLKFAPSFHVKLIDQHINSFPFECPLEPEEELNNFFREPKLLYDGDLFNVSTNPRNCRIYKASFPPSSSSFASSAAHFVQRDFSSCIEDLSPFSFHGRFPQHSNLALRHFLPFPIRELAHKLAKIFWPLLRNVNKSKINPLVLFQSNFEGAKLAMERLCCQLDVRLICIDCFEFLLNEKEGQNDEKIVEKFSNVQNFAPCVCWVRNFEVLFSGEMSAQRQDLLDALVRGLNAAKCSSSSANRWPSVFFLNISPLFNTSEVPERFAKAFHWEFRLEEGDERMGAKERAEYAEWALRNGPMEWTDTQLVNKIVEISKGFSLSQLIKLFDDAKCVAIGEYDRHSFIVANSPRLGIGHFELALKQWESASRSAGGYSDVQMEDIGGLDEAKDLLSEALAELVEEQKWSAGVENASRLRRRTGILLYGPPGCGKTMLAKAVANQAGLSFVSVKGPELLSQFVGESERNLREVFSKAKRAAPSVLFFDELDSLVPARGANSDSGGVMDRMVSQLLTELDSCHWTRNKAVFVMGATNRPDLLDPCLLSPGRFDKLVPINPANDPIAKERILRSICKKIKLEDGLSIREIARKCPEAMSGAELAGLVTTASMNRLRELIEKAELEGISDAEMAAKANFALSERHFDEAISEMTKN